MMFGKGDESIDRLESFERRRKEPVIWKGEGSLGSVLEIESTGFRSPRKEKQIRVKPDGRVKFFNGKFGFINRKHGKPLFFHWSSIIADESGYKTIADGAAVTFEESVVDGKPCAINVKEVN